MKKAALQHELDKLRRDKRSFQRGTKQFTRRVELEQLIDNRMFRSEK